jgi:hypothetical protein
MAINYVFSKFVIFKQKKTGEIKENDKDS